MPAAATGHRGGEADPAADCGVYWGAYWVVVAIGSARRRAPRAAPIICAAAAVLLRGGYGYKYQNKYFY